MRLLTPDQAEEQGYVSITTAIHPIYEAHIVKSMEATLGLCDAVWIAFHASKYEGARKKTNLVRETV